MGPSSALPSVDQSYTLWGAFYVSCVGPSIVAVLLLHGCTDIWPLVQLVAMPCLVQRLPPAGG